MTKSESTKDSNNKATVGNKSNRKSKNKLKLNEHFGGFILPGPAPNHYNPDLKGVCPRAPAVSFGYKHSINKLVIFQEKDFNYYIDFNKKQATE